MIMMLCMLAMPPTVIPHTFKDVDGQTWTVGVKQPYPWQCDQIKADMEDCALPYCNVEAMTRGKEITITQVIQ